MKNTLLVIIISLFSYHVFAQIDSSGTLNKKLNFGMKLGYGTSIINFSDNRYSNIASNGRGNASLFLNKPIVKKFAIQAGLSYTDKGFTDLEQSLDPSSNYVEVKAISYRLFYVEVPVNGVLKLPLGKGKVLLGGGPYLGFALAGNVQTVTTEFFLTSSSFEEKEEKRKLSYGNKITDDFKRTDLGFNFLTGYQFKKGWLFNINYAQGFQNILPKEQTNNGENAINLALHFCVGYEF